MKRGVVTFGAHTLYVEVPTTPQEQAHGLRGRTTLLDENGMLFLSPTDVEWSMTMEGVSVSLVMLFLDDQNRIVRALFASPGQKSLPTVRARNVLEVTPRWWIQKGSYETAAGIWVEK